NRIKDEIEKNREKDLVLFKQQRFAQMGEMISMIAHQWRQPLSNISTISGKLRLFLDLGKFDEKNFYISLEKIEEQTQYLSKTIDDFRHFFNPNKQKEMVCLREIIQKSLDIIEKAITNQGIKVVKEFAFKTKAEIYPNELTHVLLSLISNARDILLEKGIEQPCIEIYGEEFEDEYIIEIKDNGGGVPADIQDSIFLPYFSTKSKKHGTGLGLYMAKMIIEQNLGGKISQYNSENGAVFKIVLQKEH
ncbi:MAG: HAMP domain-containing histidine kinase, partial [Campylobacterales bacterium]|nr:HAMP domain-containing histidine kinase [Campylobacterales bacterium]